MSSDASYPSHLSKTKQAFFRVAEEMSKLSDHRCRIGCVVVNNHRIISSGHNSDSESHGFQKRLDEKFFNDDKSRGCKHAEIDALLPLISKKYDLSRASVYVFRRNRNGEISIARPCPRCMSVIKSLNIKHIEYTTNDGYASEVLR